MPEIVKKNPVNEPSQKPVKTHSKFTPNYSLYATHQFGVNSPFYVSEGVADDDISLRTNIDTDTFTLKAPLMQPVKRSVDYFQVPFRSIMPETAELLITNPLRGDDVNPFAVTPNLGRGSFEAFLRSCFLSSNDTNRRGINSILNGSAYAEGAIGVKTGSAYLEDAGARVFRFIQVMNLFLSKGSLVNHLGINLRKQARVRYVGNASARLDYDAFVDLFCAWFVEKFDITPDSGAGFYAHFGKLYTSGTPSDSSASDYNDRYQADFDSVRVRFNPISSSDISFREFVALLNEGRLLLSISDIIGFKDDYVDLSSVSFEYGTPYFEITTSITTSIDYKNPVGDQHSKRVNLLRLAAYQVVCAEFYTSDTVDDVYSARLYHQNMRSLLLASGLSGGYMDSYLPAASMYFWYNGTRIEYDVFSGYFVNSIINGVALNEAVTNLVQAPAALLVLLPPTIANDQNNVAAIATFGYLHNLFGFQRSLKFQDYFVGARTRPLAVGDVTVGVDTGSNTVDVIDVSKKIQVQRFLNQVNRIGRKFSDYVRGILGDKPMPDAHDPIFLGHVVDTIGAEETANTGDAQYETASGITSKFRSNSNRYGFDVHVAEPSILVGILNYDIPRVYSSVTDREVYHLDRYEFFNPYMQFVGDQEVFVDELEPGSAGNFAYQIRYAEYRQRVDRAVGGFDGYLPGYAKVIDSDDIRNIYTRSLTLGSDFIRSRMSDIDEFYLSLTGFSLASYFHFIDRIDMSVTARRPMAFAPSIL